jgi:predicted dehydrogenase
MYLDEIEHFFNCIKEGKSPAISISDGIAVLEIIQAVRESSIQKRCISI